MPFEAPSNQPETRESSDRARYTRVVSRSHGHRRTMAILLIVLFMVMLFDVGSAPGDVSRKITPLIVLRVLIHHIPVIGSPIAPTNVRYAWEIPVNSASIKPNITSDEAIIEAIVWNNRLPKVLAGVLIGMMLAMAGVAFQSLLMNPLADPYTTGVASGSALGSIFLSLAGGGIAAWFGGFALVGAAFASGLLAVSIVYMLARVSGRVSAQTFLLSGTIVGSFFFAMVPLLLSWTNPKDSQQQRTQILSTLYGSLNYIGWPQFWVLLPFGILGLILFWWDAPELDIMAMGEESAAHLGVNTEAFKRRIILLGSLMTAAAVSLAGIIAFVGFLVPHLARRLVGSNHRPRSGICPAGGACCCPGRIFIPRLAARSGNRGHYFSIRCSIFLCLNAAKNEGGLEWSSSTITNLKIFKSLR